MVGPRNGMVRFHNGSYLSRVKGFPLLWCSARPLPLEAPLNSVRLTERSRKWGASLVYELEREVLAPSAAAVDIDMGVRKRMMCSDGTVVPGARRDWKRKRALRRAASRRQRDPATRRKRVAGLQRFERRQFVRTERVSPGHGRAQQRGTNAELGASTITAPVQEWADREFVAVNPADTSRQCHPCGHRNGASKRRVFRCCRCGLSVDCDLNAAINTRRAGNLAMASGTCRDGESVGAERHAQASGHSAM